MREFKFRWWTGIKMIDSKNICVLAKNLKSPEYMQYTGLSDKNGKEIYEGDIVTFIYGDEVIAREVESDEGCFRVNCSDVVGPGSDWPCLCEITVLEVIGNIYENSELLEEDKA